MASKVLIQEQDGTPVQICFRDVTDFSPTAANDLRKGSPTLVQFDLTSVADDAFRQSTKVDLGENRAPEYAVRAALEFGATPTAGEACLLYWAPSSSATAGTGNPGGTSGADSAYTGYSSNAAASAKQLQFIGQFTTTAQATTVIQIAEVAAFVPTQRYGSLVMMNASGIVMHTDAVESHVVFDPIIPETQ